MEQTTIVHPILWEYITNNPQCLLGVEDMRRKLTALIEKPSPKNIADAIIAIGMFSRVHGISPEEAVQHRTETLVHRLATTNKLTK